MKQNYKFSKLAIAACISIAVLASCKKETGGELGPLPSVDFVASPSAGNANRIILVNTSTSAVIPSWKVLSTGQSLSGDSATVNFIFAGTYQVRMYGIGHGGIDSVTKSITIAASDANACNGTQLGFITSCTSKTWKLDPNGGAYKVGPGVNSGEWWTSPPTEVAARICEFNDEYKFSFDANGTFVYDNKGDFYGDGYLGNNTGTCQPSSNYTAAQAPWGSGNFKYVFTPNAGVNKLGQLTVVGLGAHIGLQKVRNGAEVTSGPATSITYDVIAQTHVDAGNYDILTLGVAIGAPGWWTFTLRSF